MGKYTVKDFQLGDTVYHLSEKTLVMVVLETYPESEQVHCRWINKKQEKVVDTFFAAELGKASDLGPKIRQISF